MQDLNELSLKELRREFKIHAKNGDLNAIKIMLSLPNVKENLNISTMFAEICLGKKFNVINYLLFSPYLKEESEKIQNKEFAFQSACSKGDIKQVKFLAKKLNIKINNLNRGLEFATIFGHFDIVQYLLTSNELKEHADIHYNDDTALLNCCKYGHLVLVKYLLESPELKEHSNIHVEIADMKQYPFLIAAEYSQNNIVKYFMSLTGENKLSIEENDFGVLKEYLLKGDLPMFEYIMEHETINIHLDNDYCFTNACHRKNYQFLSYFIFDLNIQRNESIDKQLTDHPDKKIEQMFEKRTLNKKLNEKLAIDISKSSKVKIKKLKKI